MPEGDTIVRIAAALRPDLVGRVIRVVQCRWEGVTGGLVGRTVERIDTVGKQMLIHFDDRTALRVHLGLHGSWHRYDPAERWQKAPSRMAMVLETDEDQLVCFDAPTVERVRDRELPAHRVLTALGPDLLASPDFEEILGRTREKSDGRSASRVLLDQHVACGLGNVYKSDLLFLCEILPHHPAESLDDATWDRLWRLGSALLARNADRPRRTREGPGPRTWVYGRAGRPCLRCGTRIEAFQEGEPPRTTYWCARCQR